MCVASVQQDVITSRRMTSLAGLIQGIRVLLLLGSLRPSRTVPLRNQLVVASEYYKCCPIVSKDRGEEKSGRLLVLLYRTRHTHIAKQQAESYRYPKSRPTP